MIEAIAALQISTGRLICFRLRMLFPQSGIPMRTERTLSWLLH